MNMLIRFVLELGRILALLMLTAGLVDALVTTSGVKELEELSSLISVVVLILFIMWYRRRGQYGGWYPVKRENLSKKSSSI